MSFTLIGRDVKRLREICERLGTRILHSSSARERLEAARALSYASDPEAVPYLENVLKASIESQYAIEGLRRVGSLEAVRALIEAAKTNLWEAKMAKSALREVQANTTDPQIQREIEASPVRL